MNYAATHNGIKWTDDVKLRPWCSWMKHLRCYYVVKHCCITVIL